MEERRPGQPGASAGEGEEDPGEGRESLRGEVVATRGESNVSWSSLSLPHAPPFCDSSVKAVDKREGAGAHNWGTMKDDIETYELCNKLEVLLLSSVEHTMHIYDSVK